MNSLGSVLDEKARIRITEVDEVKCFVGDNDRRGWGSRRWWDKRISKKGRLKCKTSTLIERGWCAVLSRVSKHSWSERPPNSYESEYAKK